MTSVLPWGNPTDLRAYATGEPRRGLCGLCGITSTRVCGWVVSSEWLPTSAFPQNASHVQSGAPQENLTLMFGPVQPTRYDLAFSLFGIPVRVIPWFWLTGVLLGFNLVRDPDQGLLLLLIWLGVMFVSILVHELGHACFAALFGYPPSILLYQFGGLTLYQPTHGYSTARSILITAAGPLFGVVLAIASFVALSFTTDGAPDLLTTALGMLLQINIFWTVLNVMPVLPLDGGQICRDVCIAASPRRGIFVALSISIVTAGVIGAGLLYFRLTFAGIMFLLLAFQNFQELQQRRS